MICRYKGLFEEQVRKSHAPWSRLLVTESGKTAGSELSDSAFMFFQEA